MAAPCDNEKTAGDDDIAVNQTSPDSPHLSYSTVDDLDESYNIYKAGVQEGDELDPNEARAVLKKIDWRLIPVLWLIYLLQVSR